MRNADGCILAVLTLLAVAVFAPIGVEGGDAMSGRAIGDDISVMYTDDPSPVAFIELKNKPSNDVSLAVYSAQEAQSIPILPARTSYAVSLEPLLEGVYTFLITDTISGTTVASINVPIGNVDYMVLTLEAGEGGGLMSPIFAEKGESLKLPSCAFDAPSGKEFKAWSIDGKEYSAGDSIVMDSDKTAKALWKESSGIGVFIIVIAAIVLIAIALLIVFLMRRKHY